MRATELMIGDWVYIYHPDSASEIHEPFKVTEVRQEGIMVAEFSDIYEDEYVHPIPIMHEMVFRNRGVCDNMGFFMSTDNPHHSGYYFADGHNHIGGFFYIHQLQHALRLCGLWELADNFKV